MTLATRVKNLLARPKRRENQTRQLTLSPQQAACKTSAVTRRKWPKKHGSQNTAKASAARSADTTAPRSTVRGKPAYATGAFPTLAPAFVRRRPRQTSRRAKRTSPQPCRPSGMLSRDGAAERRSPTRSAKPRTRMRRRGVSVASMAWMPPSFASK